MCVQVTPPTICEHDAQRGLLNLLERGLIPVSNVLTALLC